MKHKLNLLVGIFLLLLLLISTTPANAQIPAITLEVAPQTLNLYPQGESDVTLYLLNSSSIIFSNLELTSSGTAGVEAIIHPDYSRTLPALTRLAIPIHIMRSSPGFLTGELIFQLSYQWKETENGPSIQGIATANLTIQLLEPLTIDKLVDIKLDTPIKALAEKQSGIINISIQNISIYNLTITDLKPDGYQYITFTLLQPIETGDVVLPPQSTVVFVYKASLVGDSKQGDDAGYFMTHIQWSQDGQTFSGSQVLNKSIPIGVLADQSDLLKLLGLPTYLVLPGFLFVISFAFLLKYFPPKINLDLSPIRPELWVLSITFSILIIFSFRTVSLWVGHPSYFPEVFGLEDVLVLWFVSLLLGIMLWVLFWFFYNVPKEKIPTINDTPLQILKKLERNQSGIWLNQVEMDGKRRLLFPPAVGDAEKVWTISFIEYKFTSLADDQSKNEISNLVDKVDGERNVKTPKGTHDIYAVLKDKYASKKIVLCWSANEQPKNVEVTRIKTIDNILLVRELV